MFDIIQMVPVKQYYMLHYRKIKILQPGLFNYYTDVLVDINHVTEEGNRIIANEFFNIIKDVYLQY